MYGFVCWCVFGDIGIELFIDIFFWIVIFVGIVWEMIFEFIERVKGLKVIGGFEEGVDL